MFLSRVDFTHIAALNTGDDVKLHYM